MAERRVIYEGRKINLEVHEGETRSGERVVREVVVHPGAAVILPLVDREHVCLVRNYRHAVGQKLLELPAGTLSPGEDPAVCAARELEEETGYTAGRWRKLLEFYASPGIMTELMHLYLAEDLRPGHPQLEAGEELEAEVHLWDEIERMLTAGEIRDAKSLVGLLYWSRTRAGWQGERVTG